MIWIFQKRKIYFSFNIQVICNANLEIMDIVYRWSGSSPDSNIFTTFTSRNCCRAVIRIIKKYQELHRKVLWCFEAVIFTTVHWMKTEERNDNVIYCSLWDFTQHCTSEPRCRGSKLYLWKGSLKSEEYWNIY